MKNIPSTVLDQVRLGNSLRVSVANESQFGEVLTTSRTPIIELNAAYGTSILRDSTSVTGSGAVTAGTGVIDLSTGTTASSTAFLSSAEIGRYIPGFSAEGGIGVIYPSSPTGNQSIDWGLLSPDVNDGFYFGEDSTGIYTSVLKGGVETKTYQSNWNIDKLDGTGRTGYNLDNSTGTIYQVQFTYYGFGQILYGVIGIDPRRPTIQRFIPCHFVDPNGLSINSPNLRVFARVNNGGDASDVSVAVGGRQYSIVGDYTAKYRFTGQPFNKTGITTTRTNLCSFRRKSGFSNRSIKIQGAGLVVSTNNIYWEIVIGATLGGTPSYGTPTNHLASETALEVDTAGTTVTGGHTLWSDVGASGQGSFGSSIGRELDLDIPNGSLITLCASSVTGTADILGALRMKEEW